MTLESTLTEEDKDLILNEVERERRRSLVTRLYDSIHGNQYIYRSKVLRLLKLKEDMLSKTFLFALLSDQLDIDYPLLFSDKGFWRKYDIDAATELFIESIELNDNRITDRFISLFRALTESNLQKQSKKSKKVSEIKKLYQINKALSGATEYLGEEVIILNKKENHLYCFLNDYLSLPSLTTKKTILQLIIELNEFVIKIVTGQIVKDYDSYRSIIGFGEINSIPELLECSTIESPYQVVSILGKGTSGSTYKVYSSELKKYYALKVINDKFNPREAELMAKLKGFDLENIVQIHEAGKHIVKVDGLQRYAILMEYVAGDDLSSFIETVRKSIVPTQRTPNFISIADDLLTPADGEYPIRYDPILGVFSQLLNGISNLRQYGITHRDINQANVRLDQKWRLKILDFGIATDDENPMQVDARTQGVPEKRNADDLFSLGLLMYEFYTGKHLVYAREPDMDHSTHAKIVYGLKQEFFDNRENVERIIADSIVFTGIHNIIISCLYGAEIDTVKKQFEELNQPLRYDFMKRDDLIVRIRELEKELVQYHGVKGNDEVKIDVA